MIDKRAANLKNIPNVSEEVLNYLKTTIKKSDHILEFGSGGSTIWFAQHARNITSFESNIDWYRAVKKRLKELKLNNVDLRFEPDYLHKGAFNINGPFDFILVDSQAWIDGKRSGSRLICAKTSHKYLKKGGWLLLDDSSTKICINAVAFMKKLGWEEKTIGDSFNAKAWKKS